MPSVRYVARRSLVPSIVTETTVTLVLRVRYAGMNRSRRVFKNVHRALSGRRETYYEKGERSWSIGTIPLTANDSANMVMFLDSVEDGQQFEFDPDGSGWLNVVFEQDGYSEPRQPERDNMFAYQFDIVEVP
jgi:hypothetical protein